MPLLLEIGLSNAIVATALGLLAAGVGRFCRRPALTRCAPARIKPRQATERQVALRSPDAARHTPLPRR